MGSGELLSIMDDLVAKQLDSKENQKQCEENKKNGLPVPVPDHPGQIFGDLQKTRNGKTHTDMNGDLEDRARRFDESTVYGDSEEDDLDFPVLRENVPAEQGECFIHQSFIGAEVIRARSRRKVLGGVFLEFPCVVRVHYLRI